jgi:hypothetical protein
MSDGPTIGDHRFEGLSEERAIELVRKVTTGRGSGAVVESHQALARAASILLELDGTLRTQLAKLGVEWQSTAGDLAQGLLGVASDYAVSAYEPLYGSALGVETQGESHAHTRNQLPSEDQIRVTSSENLLERAGGIFGYESDLDAEERAAREAREQVTHRMSVYRDVSREILDAHRPLPPPPEITLTADPPPATPPPSTVDVDTFGSTMDTTGPSGDRPRAAASPAPGGSQTYVPPAAPTPAANAPIPGPPATPPWPTPGPPPTGPGAPGPGWWGPPGVAPAVPRAPGDPNGGGGTGARGGHATGQGLARQPGSGGPGGAGSGDSARHPAAGDRGGDPARHPGASERGGRTGAGTAATEAHAARGPLASRSPFAAGQGFAGPAAAGRPADDTEHTRRYGVRTAEPFEDDHLVAPPVLGAEAAERRT